MPKKFDDCVSDIKKKIKSGKLKKTYKCDSSGKANKRGKKRCKTTPYALCTKSVGRRR